MGEPAGLLDDYWRIARYHAPRAVPTTAIRLRSLELRQLIAYTGLRGSGATRQELFDAARSGDLAWIRGLRKRIRPSVLAGLAQTLALQEMLPTDRDDALSLYELLRRGLGPSSVPASHQGLHAQLAYVWQGPQRARELLGSYRSIGEAVRASLELDLINPFEHGGAVAPWLAVFQRLLPRPYPALEPANGLPPFDRLTVASAPVPLDEPQRVSVIVTAYQPGEGLVTAVRSLLDQSWCNLEILVVDDASPDSYAEVLARVEALGPRVTVLRQPVNQGTYAARNAGLDAATGEFVAFQDSDDWSHPRRIELQLRPMLENARIVATLSDGLSVTEDLVLTRPSMRRTRLNSSSLMFRRETVLDRAGYFDDVRKAADSEFIARLRAVYGERAVRHIGTEPLALIRLSPGSLSRSEIRPYWMHPARLAYSSAYLQWHSRAGKPQRPRHGADRPFVAPDHLRCARGAAPARPDLDVVVAGDWRFLQGPQLAAVQELRALTDRGLRVGLLHIESLRPPARRRFALAAPIQEMINTGRVTQVLPGDDNTTALLLVRHAAVLQFAAGDPYGLRPRQTLVVADQAPARSDDRDRRYDIADCTRTAAALFGVDPIWCPQDGAIRGVLRAYRPEITLTPYDFPSPVLASPVRATRVVHPPVVGTDLCDQGVWPRDARDSLHVYDSLTSVDVRLRLPDWPLEDVRLGGPSAHLVYAATDLELRDFLHQLDFYLHFPRPCSIETFSRPALEAAGQGCVVITPERHAAVFGDAAVYCAPSEVAGVIRRYAGDRVLYAEQSRRGRAVVAKAHDPQLFVDRIAGLIHAPRPPAQRTPVHA